MKTIKAFSTIVAILIIGISHGNLFAQQQSIAGFGTELEVKNYPYSGLALLQNFYFKFSSSDRHLQLVSVEPGVPNNKITLGYFDDSRNDEYFYKIAHQTRTFFNVPIRSLVFLSNGKETLDGFKPGPDFTFVLVGFQFSYRGDDHHVDEIGVLEDDGRVTAFLNDKNNDDPFLIIIHYAWLPNSLIQSTGIETGTRARGADSRPAPDGIPLISGFKFNYEPYFTNGGDHHLNEIGVLTTSTTSGDLEVYYSDKNRDDGFDWEVRWATLNEPVLPSAVLADVNEKFLAALEENDPSEVDPFIHPDFIFIDENRKISCKKQWIDLVRKGDFSYKFDESGNQVQVFDNTALVISDAEEGKVKESEPSRKLQLTQLYSFNGEHWSVIAVQLTPLDSVTSTKY